MGDLIAVGNVRIRADKLEIVSLLSEIDYALAIKAFFTSVSGQAFQTRHRRLRTYSDQNRTSRIPFT